MPYNVHHTQQGPWTTTPAAGHYVEYDNTQGFNHVTPVNKAQLMYINNQHPMFHYQNMPMTWPYQSPTGQIVPAIA